MHLWPREEDFFQTRHGLILLAELASAIVQGRVRGPWPTAQATTRPANDQATIMPTPDPDSHPSAC